MTLNRFELPDLLVTLCEAGQTSLAARIARTLLGTRESSASGSTSTPGSSSAARKPSNVRERSAEDGGVASDEPESAASIKTLQDDLKATRNRR